MVPVALLLPPVIKSKVPCDPGGFGLEAYPTQALGVQLHQHPLLMSPADAAYVINEGPECGGIGTLISSGQCL
eukprot:3556628-Karenia_brevis.AAC.1